MAHGQSSAAQAGTRGVAECQTGQQVVVPRIDLDRLNLDDLSTDAIRAELERTIDVRHEGPVAGNDPRQLVGLVRVGDLHLPGLLNFRLEQNHGRSNSDRRQVHVRIGPKEASTRACVVEIDDGDPFVVDQED